MRKGKEKQRKGEKGGEEREKGKVKDMADWLAGWVSHEKGNRG